MSQTKTKVQVGRKSNKEKLFSLSCNIRLILWIVTIIYFFLMNKLNILPKITTAYLVFFIGIFVLISDLYFKKTLGGFSVVVTGKTAVVWTILHFLLSLLLGFALLNYYS